MKSPDNVVSFEDFKRRREAKKAHAAGKECGDIAADLSLPLGNRTRYVRAAEVSQWGFAGWDALTEKEDAVEEVPLDQGAYDREKAALEQLDSPAFLRMLEDLSRGEVSRFMESRPMYVRALLHEVQERVIIDQ